MIIVPDASAVIELVLGAGRSERVFALLLDPRAVLCAPEILPLEVVQVLRQLVRARQLKERRAVQALDDFRSLRVRPYGHTALLARMWTLRDSLTAYDAAYLALAEALEATLITLDQAFAAVVGVGVNVETVTAEE